MLNIPVKLDQHLAIAHTVLGIIDLTDWDWKRAEPELKIPTEIDPKNYKSRH